jgi:ubiquitin-protein ligase
LGRFLTLNSCFGNDRSGLWRSGKHWFEFTIPDEWPHKHPEIKIATRIWHPNLEELPMNGVCLNIIKKNYNPTITIANLIVGLQLLFNEPNSVDPLDIAAAAQSLSHYAAFKVKAEEYVQNYCDDETEISKVISFVQERIFCEPGLDFCGRELFETTVAIKFVFRSEKGSITELRTFERGDDSTSQK